MAHISRRTYYRYLIADLKPQLDKCLYIDVDVIVSDSLNGLWNIDMGQNYIAGVQELCPYANSYYENKLNLTECCLLYTSPSPRD